MYVYIYACIYTFQFDPLVYCMPKSVGHRPNCANLCLCGKSVNYAQAMCKLCVNSSCQCGH